MGGSLSGGVYNVQLQLPTGAAPLNTNCRIFLHSLWQHRLIARHTATHWNDQVQIKWRSSELASDWRHSLYRKYTGINEALNSASPCAIRYIVISRMCENEGEIGLCCTLSVVNCTWHTGALENKIWKDDSCSTHGKFTLVSTFVCNNGDCKYLVNCLLISRKLQLNSRPSASNFFGNKNIFTLTHRSKNYFRVYSLVLCNM